jgi:hypothetical protein
MVMPAFDAHGNLPEGDWNATWDEITARFGAGVRRSEILAGLEVVLDMLVSRGVVEIYLDGSFVTDIRRPKDVDVVYVPPTNEDPRNWDDVGPQRRSWLKATYRVDLWDFPNWMPNNADGVWVEGEVAITIKEFFAFDRDDHPKGLVRVTGLGSGGAQHD